MRGVRAGEQAAAGQAAPYRRPLPPALRTVLLVRLSPMSPGRNRR